jgi:hypothetical protein
MEAPMANFDDVVTPPRPSWASPIRLQDLATPESEQRSSQTSSSLRDAPQRKPHRMGTVFLSVLVVVLITAAGLMLWKAFNPVNTEAPLPASEFKNPLPETVSQEAVGPTGVEPVPLENGTSMTVENMGANTLFIPALGVYMPVQADDTFVASRYSGFNTLKVPRDLSRSVRYSGGAGLTVRDSADTGTTLIAAHVSGNNKWGAIRYLYKLTGGELIYTKDAAGTRQTWQMAQMRVEKHTDFPQTYWSPEGTRQLVITTCGGKLSNSGWYQDNIFAVAVPVDVKKVDPEVADPGLEQVQPEADVEASQA